MLTDTPYKLIEKEELSEIRFSKEDVLVDQTARRLRSIYMKKAELLGEFKGILFLRTALLGLHNRFK